MTDTAPCGCVVTKRGGHTHTKLCPQCKAALFPESKAEYQARLDALREELA